MQRRAVLQHLGPLPVHHSAHRSSRTNPPSPDLNECVIRCYKRKGMMPPAEVVKDANRARNFDLWAEKIEKNQKQKEAAKAAKREARNALAVQKAAEKAAKKAVEKAKRELAKEMRKLAKAAEKAMPLKERLQAQRARGQERLKNAAENREKRHAHRRLLGKPSMTPKIFGPKKRPFNWATKKNIEKDAQRAKGEDRRKKVAENREKRHARRRLLRKPSMTPPRQPRVKRVPKAINVIDI